MWFDKEKKSLIVEKDSKNTVLMDWITVGFNDFKEAYKKELGSLRKEINLIKKTTIQKEYHLYRSRWDHIYGIEEDPWKSHDELKAEGYEFQEYLKEEKAELWVKEPKKEKK